MNSDPKKPNKLIYEKSPYLLQHAYNPVEWYPWGEEAFEAAKILDKPIFLSIGYATCHWCHVMAHESFEDSEVAGLLNETFINIKVDREELPEIDSLYMEFAMAMITGAAGWPLNLILTPNLQPFFAATYMPARSEFEKMGLVDLILRLAEIWNSEDREKVIFQAEQITQVFSESIHTKGTSLPAYELVHDSIELFYKMADPAYGGLKGAPKFPIAYQADLLWHYGTFKKDSRAIFIVERTLDMMQRGGIYDHLGGGFSRYSTDEKWEIPHFEKMLYDNALLSFSYLEAWKITKKEFYREIVEEILGYVQRDLRNPEGGFFSAEDADSEGVEGLFYTWTVQEIETILGKDEGALFCEFFSVKDFDRSVLHTPIREEEFAFTKKIPLNEFREKIKSLKMRLWEAREKRIHPFKDDKILVSWNGLMIYSLVEAGAALSRFVYIEHAIQGANFIRNHLFKNRVLLRRWRDGEANFSGGLDDYAFLIRALLSLFEAGTGNAWLEWALELTGILSRKFKESEGGFFQTDGKDPSLILRNCHFSDGAEPSGNAIHCENLLRLYQMTYEPKFLKEATDILMAAKKYMESYPLGYAYHILNLQRFYNKQAPTIVVVLNKTQDFRKEIFNLIFKQFILHRVVIWKREDDEELCRLIPAIKGFVPRNGKTTVYICLGQVCEKPLTEFDEIQKTLLNLY